MEDNGSSYHLLRNKSHALPGMTSASLSSALRCFPYAQVEPAALDPQPPLLLHTSDPGDLHSLLPWMAPLHISTHNAFQEIPPTCCAHSAESMKCPSPLVFLFCWVGRASKTARVIHRGTLTLACHGSNKITRIEHLFWAECTEF